ncbi:hypothetical protein CNMCM5623_006266 [Aspergillus felis]|uniref:GILT family thiol reductase n=1 Tax=Aspergillus felis TaxID=1287682 RepID=A0A8H6QJ84_9EURO|nr:hypothetical protein CNMCM5623_006266 [Aspergillus felis]KAF7177491.1 hypothetical protein CNMCM7691_005744 [Aspergillus felis]
MVVDSGKAFSDLGDSSHPTVAQNRGKVPSLLRQSLFTTILIFGVGLLPFANPLSFVVGTQTALLDYGDAWVGPWKVPFEVHIESRCPDARDCLQKLVVPTYWQVKDNVDFRISYVGQIWKEPRKEVTCQHGWNECDGNKLLICAEKYAGSISDGLAFVNCVLSDYERVPEPKLIEECAWEHGIDYDQIKTCADGHEGRNLLISSVEHSVAVEANFSCTVRVGGEKWCLRDDYEWRCDEYHYTVENLVEEIKRLSVEGADRHS